jgi:hypothetical protein
MSEKYPGLYEGCKAAGISYATGYARVKRHGMSIADAIATPLKYVHGRRLARKRRESYIQFPDTSPSHIRGIRAALCDEFVKTGNLNPEFLAKLKDYANEYRSAKSNSKRVQTEHASSRSNQSSGDVQNDSGGIGMPLDTGACGQAANFLFEK